MLLKNNSKENVVLEWLDNVYNTGKKRIVLKANAEETLVLDLTLQNNWYDFSVMIPNNLYFLQRYAGRVEYGKETYTDPHMGGLS